MDGTYHLLVESGELDNIWGENGLFIIFYYIWVVCDQIQSILKSKEKQVINHISTQTTTRKIMITINNLEIIRKLHYTYKYKGL